MDQWVDWLTRSSPEDEPPNNDRIIEVFTVNKKDYGKPDPNIKSWEQPVGALNDLLKKRCKLKGALVFYPYRWKNAVREFSSDSTHKGWNNHHGVIHNTYHGGNFETDHHVILSISEDVANHFEFPNFTTPVPGTLREALDNNTTAIEKVT